MPPLISQPLPTEAQPATFVGREQELGEFRTSVSYMLEHEQPPAAPDYPHIFLVYGEGGMGKSALLHQFEQIARQEGMQNAQIIKLDLEYQQFLTTEALAQALAYIVRQKNPDFDHQYRSIYAQREILLPRYTELRKQWIGWEALREYANETIEEVDQRYHQLWNKSKSQRTNAGKRYEPIDASVKNEQALASLNAIRNFRNAHGNTPQSFDELLRSQLGQAADIFLNGHALAQALSKDLYDLAEKAPILLVIDAYENIEQHDPWIRNDFLRNSSSRMLTIIAGRNPFKKYGQAFRHLIRSYNLNSQLLQPEQIQEYLEALDQAPSRHLVDKIYAISQGIPIALEALENEFSDAGSLNTYQNVDFTRLDQRLVVATLTQHLLNGEASGDQNSSFVHAQRRHDLQRIQALALLLRPDNRLLSMLWDLPYEQVGQALQTLNDQYSFVFDRYRGDSMLHALVRKYVRRHIFEHRRGSVDWPVLEAGLRRLEPALNVRIARIERHIIDIDARYKSAEWRGAKLDMLNMLLWLGEHKPACRLILNSWISAQYANPSFANELIDLANEFVSKTLYLSELVHALETGAIFRSVPKNFASMIEPHSRAVLAFLRAQSMRIGAINADMLAYYRRYIGYLEQSYELDRDWMPIQAELATAYATFGHYYLYRTEDHSTALYAYDRAIEFQSDDPLLFKHRGIAKHNLGDLTGALRDFAAAQAICARDPQAASQDAQVAPADRDRAAMLLHQQGTAKLKQGDIASARSDFAQALLLRPDAPDILVSRAHARFLNQDIIEALTDLDRALTLRPDHQNTRYNRGILRNIAGDLDGAVDDFEAARALAPRDIRPIYRAARIYAQRNQPDFAIERLGQVVALDRAFQAVARNEPDFAALHADPRFDRLVNS